MDNGKTIIKISLDNFDKLKSSIDLSGIENDEQHLRFIHSIVEELRIFIINRLIQLQEEKQEDKEF
jgi:hypothetical protein